MKKTASIFIPHMGCPNDCVFCNQVKITGVKTSLNYDQIKEEIETSYKTIKEGTIFEIAFFGGSFTAIEDQVQENCLEIAKHYKDTLKTSVQIKMSTRPDAIDEKIIQRLKKYTVDTVELGVQSFCQEVLDASNRGHSVQDVYKASKLIKDANINLGIQLMIGLPKDNFSRLKQSVEETIKIHPQIARLYPVYVIKDTKLEQMYKDGSYKPLDIKTAIQYTKYAYSALNKNNIKVIRTGLQATEEINPQNVVAGPVHEAFGQLVIDSLYKDYLEQIIETTKPKELQIKAKQQYISYISGNKKSNKNYIQEKYKIKMQIQPIKQDKIEINGKTTTHEDILNHNY